MAEVLVKNKFCVGDLLEVIRPAGNLTIQLEHMESLNGEPMREVPGGGYQIRIPLPKANYSKALLARNLQEPTNFR